MKLADNLNAEIVQGTVQSVADAAQWLGYTYLYVRMLQNPAVYSVPPDQLDKDPVLLQFRVDLVSVCCERCFCPFLVFLSFFSFFPSPFALAFFVMSVPVPPPLFLFSLLFFFLCFLCFSPP